MTRIPLRERFKRLSLWNKLGVIGVIASIIGAVPVLWAWLGPERVEPPAKLAEPSQSITGSGNIQAIGQNVNVLVKHEPQSSTTPVTEQGNGSLQFEIALDPKEQRLLQDPTGGRQPDRVSELDSTQRETSLTYVCDTSDARRYIKPRMPYLLQLAHGGPLLGLSEPFRWGFPTLSFKMLNQTHKTIYLTNIVVEVVSSTIGREPVPVFGIRTWRKLVITNEGWGKVVEPTIAFGFAPSSEYTAVDPATRKLNHEIKLESFDGATSVSVADYFPDEVRTETKTNPNGSVVTTMTLPPMNTCMFGLFSYKTEQDVLRRIWFKTVIDIAFQRLGAVVVTTAAHGVYLPPGQKGYRTRIPISHSLEPGEPENFLLTIATEASASFDLTVSLNSVGEAVVATDRLLVDILVPRSQIGKYRVTDIGSAGKGEGVPPLEVPSNVHSRE